jgi:hypothetical protein
VSKIDEKCGLNEGTCSWKQKNHYLWSCKHIEDLIWVSSEHLEGSPNMLWIIAKFVFIQFCPAWICGQNHSDCALDFTLCDFTILKLKVIVIGSGFNITMMQAKLQDATGHITKFAWTSGTLAELNGHSRWDSIG